MWLLHRGIYRSFMLQGPRNSNLCRRKELGLNWELHLHSRLTEEPLVIFLLSLVQKWVIKFERRPGYSQTSSSLPWLLYLANMHILSLTFSIIPCYANFTSFHFISGVTMRIRKRKMTFHQSGTEPNIFFTANVSCVNICDRKP